MGYRVIGTCSLCGGQVATPDVWHGIIPPVPTCMSCGAIAAQHGPIIEMTPAPHYVVTYGTSTKS